MTEKPAKTTKTSKNYKDQQKLAKASLRPRNTSSVPGIPNSPPLAFAARICYSSFVAFLDLVSPDVCQN